MTALEWKRHPHRNELKRSASDATLDALVRIWQFGVFELDQRAGELRKRGVRIKLQDQPLRILCALLDRPGEFVSRESLKSVLWPKNTFVEFERGLNAAVAKLRQALGDSAENPRFIETLAGRGYRFLAPTHEVMPTKTRSADPVPALNASPTMNFASKPITLVERDQELDQLRRLLAAAVAGQGSLALISGEPGVGKTHLTRAILADAAQRRCLGVVGHCYEMEGAPPYVPFVEMLEHYVRVAPKEMFRESLGNSASEVAKLMPELRRIFPEIPSVAELPPEQRRRSLFNAYREFTQRSASLVPLVMVFEDIHWADESSMLLLHYLAQTVTGMPVLMIGTYRDADLDVGQPFAGVLEGWIRERAAIHIQLHPLGIPGVRSLLQVLSGQVPPDSLVAAFFDRTEGNPFFVEEVFRHLIEERRMFDPQGEICSGLRIEEWQVPQSVRLVIRRRLERLSKTARSVLATAAVVGRSFSLLLLEDFGAPQSDTVLEAIEEADRAHLVLVEPAGREAHYRFVHELVRQTLAEELSKPRRQRLHARIAASMERIYAANLESRASALAHHLCRAGTAADPEKTITFLMMAARRATVGAAHEEALANIEFALSLLETPRHPRAAELHAARAEALRSLWRASEAIEAYQSALESYVEAGNAAAAADASFELGYIHLWKADGARALAVADRALRLLDEKPTLLRQRLLFLKASGFGVKGDMEGSFAALSEAQQMETSLPDKSADGFASMCQARLHFLAAQMEQAAQYGREAITRFRAVGNSWGEAEIFETITASVWLGRPTEIEDALRDSLALAERVGHKNAVWSYKGSSRSLFLAGGDLEAAERAAHETLEFGLAISSGWAFLDYVFLGVITHYLGRLDEACTWLRAGLEIEPPTYFEGLLSGGLFWTLATKGDPGSDAALSLALTHIATPGRKASLGSLGCVPFVVEGLALLGRTAEVAALEPNTEHAVANGPYCVYSQHLFRTSAGIAAACAGHWTRAEEHHRTAIHQADTAPYRVAQPVARYWYADMLIARDASGDRDRARSFLSEALQFYRSLGMERYACRAADKLSKL